MSGITDPTLKGKRKKPVPKVANPLFVRWLTEWKQEAAEKGWMSVHTYAKALKTLKLFPLRLETGKDCRLLQNFGDKICKMLDEKLAEHKQNQAVQGATDEPESSVSNSVSGNVTDTSQSNSAISIRSKDSQTQGKTQLSNSDLNHASSSGTSVTTTKVHGTVTALDLDDHRIISATFQSDKGEVENGRALKSCNIRIHTISDSSDSDAEAQPPQKVKRKPKSIGSRSREYVPTLRSGAYALILTLYRYMQDPAFKGYMGKSELSHAAQPLCDKSFVISDPGSHYTAWSSMGSLIKKGLVLKTSHPARYSLTEAGTTLGERLDRAEKTNDNTDEADENFDRLDRLSIPQDINKQLNSRRNGYDHSSDKAGSVPGISPEQNHIDFDEDGDLERAIAESLLSYSQEVSIHSPVSKVSSLSDDNDGVLSKTIDLPDLISIRKRRKNSDSAHVKPSTTSQTSCHGNEKAVLILSDEDDDVSVLGISQISPARIPRRLHALSPSPSPPPPCDNVNQHFSPGSLSDTSESQTKLPGRTDSLTTKTFTDKQPNSTTDNIQPEIFPIEIMEISDDDSDDNKSGNRQRYTCISQKTGVCDGYSSDELPDLNLPLSKRLLLKSGVTSELLISSSTSSTNSLPIHSESENAHTHAQSGTDSCRLQENCTSDHSSTFTAINMKSSFVNSSNTSASSGRPELVLQQRYAHDLQTGNTNDIGTKLSSVGNSGSREETTTDVEIEQWNTQCSQASSSSSSATSTLVSVPVPVFTLQPGSFEIVLCLDNREFYGSKSSSKTLLPELMKNGIQCDLRLLHVGDLLWIAREKTAPGSGRAQGKELVLHYIIERKRMDDLVSSMTDGRMKEQKFRLKHCGLSQPIILIEEYGSIQNFSISEEKIKQSIVNSQIIDGFKVKRCNGLKEAVAYLAMMTHHLNLHYRDKTLHAVSVEQHKQLKNQQPMEKKEHYLMSFETFNEASVKHKDLTVKELFAKQLIQIPGVSADRAKAITNVYPTISALLEGYKHCSSEKDKEKLLATIKCGKRERNLGIAISRMLYLLYTQKGSLS